jgi:hypothetical protein
MSELLDKLQANLDSIEAIARDLPKVGKRSELQVKADEILRLTELVRREAVMLEQKQTTGKYTPDFRQYGGGAAGKKD